ncbi:MAG: ThiF family adenylyltransferase [Pirellulales bacterium]
MDHEPQLAQSDLHCQLSADTRIVLIGLGGIGGAVLQYLALFLHHLQLPLRLVLVDGDKYQPRDSARQTFGTLGNKAEVKARETLDLLPESQLTIVPLPEYVGLENIGRVIKAGDHVLLCVDNHPTRKMVADHCHTLADVVLLSGGNDGIEPPDQRGTYGNVQIAIRQAGRDATAPLTRFHPELAQPQGSLPGDLSCGELVQSVPQILFTNLAVASAMLSAYFAYLCGRLHYQEVQLDILEARMLPLFPIKPESLWQSATVDA